MKFRFYCRLQCKIVLNFYKRLCTVIKICRSSSEIDYHEETSEAEDMTVILRASHIVKMKPSV